MSDERGELERLFPGAPARAYLSEEGWLVVGSEAYTREEWLGYPGAQFRRAMDSKRRRQQRRAKRRVA